MSSRFVHLNLHSEFSLADGILRIGPLIERTKALGMPAVAITDRANLFCMVRFYTRGGRWGNQADHRCRSAARKRIARDSGRYVDTARDGRLGAIGS